MAVPIWKDYYVTISGTEANFRIRLGGSTGNIIYSGKAVARPNETSVVIRINNICSDYVGGYGLPSLTSQGVFVQPLVQTFYIESLSGSSWAEADTVDFYNDWSYDYDFASASQPLSNPIRTDADARMPLLYSQVHTGSVTVKVGSTTSTMTIAQPSTIVVEPSEVSKVEIGSFKYNIIGSCYKYALYYVNAYGGWDELLIKGTDRMSDAYNRFNIQVAYDNTDIENRGERNYANEIDRTITLNTGWMTDDESSRMHHLLGSSKVYLYDIAEGQMIPALITNSDCPYKTFKNEGGSLVNYELTIKIAHNLIRK